MAAETITKAQHQKEIDAITKKHDDAIAKMKAGHDKALDSVKTQLDKKDAVIENLQKELEKASAAPAPTKEAEKPAAKLEVSKETFTYDKNKYGFAYPSLKLNGRSITAADVLADTKLQKELIEMGSGFVVKM